MKREQKEKRRQQLLQKQKEKERRSELVRQIKPLLLTFVVWFALKAIISIPPIGETVSSFFVNFTAQAAYWFGRVLFLPVEMNRVPFLAVNGYLMKVIWECTAYNFYLFVIVLTIFARWPLKHKFISLGLFILVIFVMNNLRFITMGYVGSYWPNLFDSVHDYLWSIVFGFLVFGIWAWREIVAQRIMKVRAVKG